MQSGHTKLTRILHWSNALLIISLIAVGWYMTGLDGSVNENKYTIYKLHKSFGLISLVIAFLFVINRVINKNIDFPKEMPRYQQVLARIEFFFLYLLSFSIPFSGFLMSGASEHGLHFFGIDLPRIISLYPELANVAHAYHVFFPYVLLGLLVIHLSATIIHLFEGTDMLKRMI